MELVGLAQHDRYFQSLIGGGRRSASQLYKSHVLYYILSCDRHLVGVGV